MMIDRIISYLKTSGVTAWEITDELTYGWEFYFIRHELDQNRVKNVETIILKRSRWKEKSINRKRLQRIFSIQ